MDKVPMTVKGAETLRLKVKQLKEVERPQVTRDIEIARAHGDLSENAEYHAAREKQGWIEAQIRDYESRLSVAEIIDPSKLSGDRVLFGATVTLLDLDSENEITYQIVGTDEAEPKEGRISVTSPLGRALIGKETGDEVAVQAPGGQRAYSIEDVRFE
jgi:transcription elongation factor GreA